MKEGIVFIYREIIIKSKRTQSLRHGASIWVQWAFSRKHSALKKCTGNGWRKAMQLENLASLRPIKSQELLSNGTGVGANRNIPYLTAFISIPIQPASFISVHITIA